MSSQDSPNESSAKDTDYDGFGAWIYDAYESDEYADLPPTPNNLFRPGMAMELNEVNYPGMWCVGSIKRVSGDFVLAHFDGWEDYWDVWYRWDASELRPVGTCDSLSHNLDPPYSGPDAHIWAQTGDWNSYLAHKNATAAPIEAFSTLFVSESNDSSMVQSLLGLAANRVASVMHCYAFLDIKIGHTLYKKLQDARVCDICHENYLIGYKCVKAFALQKYLRSIESRPLHTGNVCSPLCLSRFKKYYIGYLPQENFQIFEHNDSIKLPLSHLAMRSSRNPQDREPNPNDKPSSKNLFRVGMKVEAIDPEYPTWYCACTVLRSCGDEVLLTFDGWGNSWDMWCYWHSPEMRPIGTATFLGYTISIDCPAREVSWAEYLKETNSIVAPVNAFSKLYICEFGENHGGITPLSILTINTLLQCKDLEKLYPKKFAQRFPFIINGVKFLIRECCICGKPYFQGWLAVNAFILRENLNSLSGYSRFCSKTCLRQFHTNHIGEF